MFPKPKRVVDRNLLDSFHTRNCIACGRRGCDPAHVLTRGAGNSDDETNVIALCRKHHTEQGQIGWRKFCHKFPSVELHLFAKGWTFDDRNRIVKV